MVPILVWGEDGDQRTAALLVRFLAKRYGVLHLGQEKLRRIGQGPVSFLVVESRSLQEFDLPGGVVVLKHGAQVENLCAIGRDTLVILDSSNEAALHALMKREAYVLTCGLRSKDTVTVSSRQEDDAVISLQREIVTFTGRKLEPMELVFRNCAGVETAQLLLLATLLFTLGLVEEMDPIDLAVE